MENPTKKQSKFQKPRVGYTQEEFLASAKKYFPNIRPLGPQDVSWSEAARRKYGGPNDDKTICLEVTFFPNRRLVGQPKVEK